MAHGLLSVALLGAITHQAASVFYKKSMPLNQPGFVNHFRSVVANRYTQAICVLWVACFVFGGMIYIHYRIDVRIPIEQQAFYKTLGAFELKEHLAVFGLGLLPFYRMAWLESSSHPALLSARKWTTVFLAGSCWYIYLAGHWVNNVRGFGG